MEQDKPAAKYACAVCGNLYTTMKIVRQHQKASHGIGINPGAPLPSCPECFRVFRSIKTLYSHRKTCIGKFVAPKETVEFECEHCDKVCSTRNGLSRHIQSAHPEKLENDEFHGADDASMVHESTATQQDKDVDIYVCLECNKVCAGQTGFYRHRSYCNSIEGEKSSLRNIRRKFCENCEEVFESHSAYHRHAKKCGNSLENEIALINKARRCHYFRCDVNQSDGGLDSKDIRLFCIPYQSQREFLERMNIASLAPNIPLFASLRICSNHFPDSAFDKRYRFKKLIRGSLPFDWRESCDQEEVDELESNSAHKRGEDILEFIKAIRLERIRQELGDQKIDAEDEEDLTGCDGNSQKSSQSIDEAKPPVFEDCDDAMDTADFGDNCCEADEEARVIPKEKVCRLCGDEKEGLINIFDGAGVDMEIPQKIEKVLPITVCESDDLPHQVCIQCAGGIDFIYQMFEKITQTEKILTETYCHPPILSEPNILFPDAEENVDLADTGFDTMSCGTDSVLELENHEEETVAFDAEEELDLKAHEFALQNSKDPLNEVSYSPLGCSACCTPFDNVDEYVDHYRIEHKKFLLVCTLCQVFFDNIGNLREHWHQLHSQSLQNKDIDLGNGVKVKIKQFRKKYECRHCRKTFNERYLYRAHLADELRKIKAQMPATFKCNYCEEMFVSEMNKTWHMLRTHHEYTPYQCSVCERKFRLKHSRDKHEECHRKESLEDTHLCNICGKILPSKPMLRQHMRMHMDPLPCPVCEKMLVPDRLRIHMRKHKNHRPYSCTKCNASFQFAHKLKKHMLLHAECEFSCEKCTFKATKRTVLYTHMQKMHGIEFSSVVKCTIPGCGAVFETNRELYEHSCEEHSSTGCIQRNILEGTDGFLCKYCETKFEVPTCYSNHIRKVHVEVEEPFYTCNVCRFETKRLIDLGVHLETHPECCRFQCQQCPLKFSTSRRRGSHEFGTHFRKKKICPECGKGVDNLADHMNIHKGLKPYKCPTCGMDFARQTNWKMHLAVHMDHRPHKCSLCDSAFRTKGEYNRHLKLHTASVIYECDSCSYACTSKQTIRKHTQKHHFKQLPVITENVVQDEVFVEQQLIEEQAIAEHVLQQQMLCDTDQIRYYIVELNPIE